MSDIKVLFIATSHQQLGDTQDETGVHLFELTKPFTLLTKAGMDVDIASPRGGAVPIDPGSYDLEDDTNKAFMDNPDFRRKLEHSIALREVNANQYKVVYFPGGHGTMWDFPDNPQIENIVKNIYEGSEGIVSGVCHGPAAFVNLKLTNGDFLVKGKKLTCFTNSEEVKVEKDKIVPFLLESKLVEQGAHFSGAALFQKHVVEDGRLITGQNPASAEGIATKIIAQLK